MASTDLPQPAPRRKPPPGAPPDCVTIAAISFCGKKFGRRVWKVSLDAGCTCPNRDGSLGTAGCIFCDPESFSPSRRLRLGSITAQLEEGIRRVRQRHAAEGFVAYFQPATNTYGPLDRLRRLYEEALGHPQVVGLAIGTRPDCAGDAVLDMLAELSARTWLTIEFGLQTIHDRTLDWLSRGITSTPFWMRPGGPGSGGWKWACTSFLACRASRARTCWPPPGRSPGSASLGQTAQSLCGPRHAAGRDARGRRGAAAGAGRIRQLRRRLSGGLAAELRHRSAQRRCAPRDILSVRSGGSTRRRSARRSRPSCCVAAVGRDARIKDEG